MTFHGAAATGNERHFDFAGETGERRSKQLRDNSAGIRAYDTQKEVASNNKKLLDFVARAERWSCNITAAWRILTMGISLRTRGAKPGAGFRGRSSS